MTEDNFASSILAGLLLIIMFGSMRAFYGCWPWEYRKTWYRTQKEIAHLNALMGPSRPSDRRPEPADTDVLREKIAESLREKIAESMSRTPPYGTPAAEFHHAAGDDRDLDRWDRAGAPGPMAGSDDALRADRENEYPKQSTRFG